MPEVDGIGQVRRARKRPADQPVSIDGWWSMEGACGAEHPSLEGVVCVRDRGHPGFFPKNHRFWLKQDGRYVEVVWPRGLREGGATGRTRLASPRPAPGRSVGGRAKNGNGSDSQ